LEGIVITPKLVGDKVGLSAFATMLVLIIGGNLFGLMGMIIAIPLAAIIKSLIKDLKIEYQQLDLYKS
jgi:predicted PurR-regulated permease PerM